MSKATPLGAIAQFAAGGKPVPKKDMGLAMTAYGNVYVARVAMGANPGQTVKAFAEADAFNGPSLLIAYSHCIAHGIDMARGLDAQKKAVDSGHWIMFRYNPDLVKQGKNPFVLDSKPPSIPFEDYAKSENRFRALLSRDPERAKRLFTQAQEEIDTRFRHYQYLAAMKPDGDAEDCK
jgi:pyruvate-ferredoxin/flavodoxin oxidoreductase